MEKEIIHGYAILKKYNVGTKVFALGFNENAVQPYVTWQGNTESPGYEWGHYKSTLKSAEKDLHERIRNEKENAPYMPLPEKCFSIHPSTGEVILIKRDEMGFVEFHSDTATPKESRQFVDMANEARGISRDEEAAMCAGSMFGWNVPAANPRNYDENGKPIKHKNKDPER